MVNIGRRKLVNRRRRFTHFGIARIEEPKDTGDVRGYCTKYVSKGAKLNPLGVKA
jgi:hypothetical protein